MKILVIGRRGQLARSLAERVAARHKFEFIFAGRPDLDLTVPGSAAALVAKIKPQLVINAAAYTAVDQAEEEPELAFRINAGAAGEISGAGKRIGASVVQISTDYVFSGRSKTPYRENDATGPLNVYGASKLAGEEQVRAANGNYVIVRTSWVVSAFGRNFVATIMRAASTRAELTVVSDQLGRPTAAGDLADAILTIVERGAFGETFHVANSGEASWYVLARAIMDECRLVGAPVAQVKPILTCDWQTPARRPAYSVLDCTRFEQMIGGALPNWRRSVREIVRRLAGDS